jgi:hypothetical protein
MTGDCHVQFSESARVRFPRATRLAKKWQHSNSKYSMYIIWADQVPFKVTSVDVVPVSLGLILGPIAEKGLNGPLASSFFSIQPAQC